MPDFLLFPTLHRWERGRLARSFLTIRKRAGRPRFEGK